MGFAGLQKHIVNVFLSIWGLLAFPSHLGFYCIAIAWIGRWGGVKTVDPFISLTIISIKISKKKSFHLAGATFKSCMYLKSTEPSRHVLSLLLISPGPRVIIKVLVPFNTCWYLLTAVCPLKCLCLDILFYFAIFREEFFLKSNWGGKMWKQLSDSSWKCMLSF